MAVSRLSKQSIQAGFPKQQTVWDQSTNTAAMDAISSITLAAAQSTIEFNNIPQTYTHLQIRMVGQGTSSGVSASCYCTFNGTSSGYYMHQLYGEGSAAHGSADSTSTNFDSFYMTGASQSSVWGAGIMEILDYTNTTKYKNAYTFSGNDYNGGGLVLLRSGLWQNTAAINSITFTTNSSFAAKTSFALYGIK